MIGIDIEGAKFIYSNHIGDLECGVVKCSTAYCRRLIAAVRPRTSVTVKILDVSIAIVIVGFAMVAVFVLPMGGAVHDSTALKITGVSIVRDGIITRVGSRVRTIWHEDHSILFF